MNPLFLLSQLKTTMFDFLQLEYKHFIKIRTTNIHIVFDESINTIY